MSWEERSDTVPVPVPPAPPAPSTPVAADPTWTTDGNAARCGVPDWSDAFADLPPGRARSTRAARRRAGLAIVVAALMLIVAGAVALWPSPKRDDHLSTGTPKSTTSTPAPSDQDTLAALLQGGYPPGACTPSPDVMLYPASLTCGQNADPDGPAAATYQLVGAHTSLTEAFHDATASFTRTDCPGNIQSPGPWRRAGAKTVTGVLFCGLHRGQAVIAWSTDDQRLLNIVWSGPSGPTLDQLYAWWSTHS
jgi:hypothetical protein